MFEFLMDVGNYQERKIGRDNFDWGFVSTARVSDGQKPYETAVAHTSYRDKDDMVIVENYDTHEEAEAGHKKWLQSMTADILPAKLVDCNNSGVAQLGSAIGGTEWDTEYPLRARA